MYKIKRRFSQIHADGMNNQIIICRNLRESAFSTQTKKKSAFHCTNKNKKIYLHIIA